MVPKDDDVFYLFLQTQKRIVADLHVTVQLDYTYCFTVLLEDSVSFLEEEGAKDRYEGVKDRYWKRGPKTDTSYYWIQL